MEHSAYLNSESSPMHSLVKPAMTALSVALITVLGGCASTDTRPSAAPTVARPATVNCPAAANLLADPTFASLLDSSAPRVWRARQHSRGRDFATRVNNKTLTIEKTGHEPWFVLSQRLAETLPAGAELQYDALLKLDTHEPEHSHGFGYVSGLYLIGYKGRQPAFRSMAEHEPHLGEHAEQRVITRIKTDDVIDRLEAGFIHQAGGAFTVREPRLVNLTRYPGCRLP